VRPVLPLIETYRLPRLQLLQGEIAVKRVAEEWRKEAEPTSDTSNASRCPAFPPQTVARHVFKSYPRFLCTGLWITQEQPTYVLDTKEDSSGAQAAARKLHAASRANAEHA
jgi:hypothetical protein